MKIGALVHKKLKRNKAQNIQFCLSECVQTLAMNKRMSNLLCIIHFSVPFLPLDNNATFVENNFPFPVNMVGCIFSSLFHLEHPIPSTFFCFTFFSVYLFMETVCLPRWMHWRWKVHFYCPFNVPHTPCFAQERFWSINLHTLNINNNNNNINNNNNVKM